MQTQQKTLKYFAPATLLLASATASANFTPPQNCVNGETLSDLTVVAPTYFAVGVPARVKGDFPFVVNDSTKSVAFFNSHDNYVGGDNTDFWDNAYIDMVFPLAALGNQEVWAIDETNPITLYCSKTTVAVQTIPTISNTSLSGGQSINLSLTATISSYSKRYSQGNTTPLMKYKFTNIDYNQVEIVNTVSQSLNFHPEYTGFYLVEATAMDGTFETKVSLGYVQFTGGTIPDDGFGNDVPIR